jgi:hypothetical protein
MVPKVFDAPNGDKIEIKPLTQNVVKQASINLSKIGLPVKNDSSLETNIVFAAELARLATVTWINAEGQTQIPARLIDQRNLFEERSKVTGWILSRARELADETDKDFEEQAGN